MSTVARGAKSGGGSNFNAGQVIDPAEVNQDFNTLYAEMNGLLDNSNLETATIPGAKSFRFTEISDPSSPASDDLLLYAKDDTAGVTRLYTKDAAGLIRVVTTAEPLVFELNSVATIANTSSTPLHTYTLPAGTLAKLGDRVHLTAWGSFAANANTKTIQINFGGTAVTQTSGTYNNVRWRLYSEIVRVSATTQASYALAQVSGVASSLTISAPGETLANAIVVGVYGLNGVASANDIASNYFLVEFFPYQPRA